MFAWIRAHYTTSHPTTMTYAYIHYMCHLAHLISPDGLNMLEIKKLLEGEKTMVEIRVLYATGGGGGGDQGVSLKTGVPFASLNTMY